MIDVHTFDGQWSHDITTKFSLKDKIFVFNILYNDVKKITNINETSGLLLIMKDSQKISNYDSVNKLYADDILVEIFKKLIKLPKEDRIDMTKILIEQTQDMFNLGQCASGRVTRLFQIYKCL